MAFCFVWIYDARMGSVQLAGGAEELVRGRARVGEAELIVCTDGTALFDGGAMFGVVPKVLWQRKVQADALNRIPIGLNCLVVRLHGKTVLVETGFGNKLSPKLQGIYGTQQVLPQSLHAAGVEPGEVDLVINTHLHWDHCGWNSVLDEAGVVRPYFPNAEYVAHAGEVEHGRRQFERDRVSYVAENYEPLLATGQMRAVNVAIGEELELLPGVSVECFPGHTAHMMVVHVRSRGEHACFVSDLVPTAAHLDLTWGMGFDLDPMAVISERKRFYARAVAEGWLVVFPHDHLLPMVRLTTDVRGAVVAAMSAT